MQNAESQGPDSLDEIWGGVRAHIQNERKIEKAKVIRRVAEAPQAVSTQQLYLDPANWTRTCGVALIHKESQTVLGNFSKYLHTTGATKLVREEAPIAVTERMEVEGSWWLGAERKVEKREEWHEKRPAIIHLHLDKLAVHAPAVEVIVHLSYGSMARVELATETQFAHEVESNPTMLWLPAGTNVLEVMSRDCKAALFLDLKVPQ